MGKKTVIYYQSGFHKDHFHSCHSRFLVFWICHCVESKCNSTERAKNEIRLLADFGIPWTDQSNIVVKKVSPCRRIPSFDWDSLKLFLWRWSLKWPLKCPFSSHSGIRLREFLANERRLIAVEFINWSVTIKIKNNFMTISFGVSSQGP